MADRVYLNWRGPKGRETVDEFEKDGKSAKEFREYISEMVIEYNLAGMNIYQSSRKCANWN